MGRVFSNGPLKDFVINPFTDSVSGSTQISVMSPFVTRVDDLIEAAKSGKRVDLLVGLNSTTSPAALSKAHQQHGIQVRYYAHHRFHAKVYLFDTAAIIGSSNLTDAGLMYNREATIVLNDGDDAEDIVDLRAIFEELWDAAPILTDDVLKRFAEAHQRFSSAADEKIAGFVGEVAPPNVNIDSQTKKPSRVFLEDLRRQISDYRKAFVEVSGVLEEDNLHRAELMPLGGANQANRFLSWVRSTYATGDSWEKVPVRSQEERRGVIVAMGQKWTAPDSDRVSEAYIAGVKHVQDTFSSVTAIDEATKEELTEGLVSLHAFGEQYRFVKKEVTLPIAFWNDNDDVHKVKKTLKYLLYGGGDFVVRLYDVLYGRSLKLRLFGLSCSLELFGTIKPEEFPPINQRIVKGLKYIGFDVRGA
jgi:hypothetical protein